MPKLSICSSRRKGQWYLVSAVVVSSAFVVISLLLKSYFIIETSDIASSEDFYFRNIDAQLKRTIELSTMTTLETNLNNIIYFTQTRMNERGILLDIDYTITNIGNKNVEIDIILATDQMSITKIINY